MTKVVDKLKEMNPQVLLTVEDRASVVLLTAEEDDETRDENQERWAEYEEIENDTYIVLMTKEIAFSLKISLSNK